MIALLVPALLSAPAHAQNCPASHPVCFGVDGAACAFSDFNTAYAAAASVVTLAGVDGGGGQVQVTVSDPSGLLMDQSGVAFAGATTDCTAPALLGGRPRLVPAAAVNNRLIRIDTGGVAFDAKLSRLILDGGDQTDGGLVLIDNGSASATEDITVNYVKMMGGHADNDGGCIWARDIDSLSFLHSRMSGCSAGGDGGGLYAEASALGPVVIDFDDGRMDGNTAGGSGGGLWANYATVDLFSSAKIDLNAATLDGGGVYLDESTLTVRGVNTLFEDNVANDGGALFLRATNFTISDATFRSNDALDDGGAMAWFDPAGGLGYQADIDGVARFESNTAVDDGGAIFAELEQDDPLLVDVWDDVLFDANTAGSVGGAMAVIGTIVKLHDDVRLQSNTGINGGAIFATTAYPPWPTPSVPSSIQVLGSPLVHQVSAGPGLEPAPLGGVQFVGNSATGAGGAVYLATSTLGAPGEHVVFDSNTAPRGSAVRGANASDVDLANAVFIRNDATDGEYTVDISSGVSLPDVSEVSIRSLDSCVPVNDFAGIPDRYCSEFHSNIGGGIRIHDNADNAPQAELFIGRVSFWGNDQDLAGAADLDIGEDVSALVQDSLFHAGTGVDSVIVRDLGELDLTKCTISHANVLPVHFEVGATGQLLANVLWPYGGIGGDTVLVVDGALFPGSLNVGDGITNAVFSSGTGNINANPQYTTEPVRGSDVHLALGSAALDVGTNWPYLDLDGQVHPVAPLTIDAGCFEGAF